MTACAGPSSPGPAPVVYAVPPAGQVRLAAAPRATPAVPPHHFAAPAPAWAPVTRRPTAAPVRLAELPPPARPEPAALPPARRHPVWTERPTPPPQRHVQQARRIVPPPAKKPTAAPHPWAPKIIPLQSPEAETRPAPATPPPAARREAALSEPGPAARETRGTGFLWPVRGRILSGFGRGLHGAKNDGINIAAPLGAPIEATAAGTVAYAGNELHGYGNLILITHRQGWISAYAHCQMLLVKRGQTVRRGQVIARVGTSGNVTTPQLHFELRRGEQPVDPLEHLGPVPTAAAGPPARAAHAG